MGPVERLRSARLGGRLAAQLTRLPGWVRLAVAAIVLAVIGSAAGYAAIGGPEAPPDRFVAPAPSGPAGDSATPYPGASGGLASPTPTAPASTASPDPALATPPGDTPGSGDGLTPSAASPSASDSPAIVRVGGRCSPVGAVAVTPRGLRVECVGKAGGVGRWRRA